MSGDTALEGTQVSDAAWVEANRESLAAVVAMYRELREARAKLAVLETLARDIHRNSGHSDYADGRWEMARRILDVLAPDTVTGVSSEDECADADQETIRALLAKHGYDPDLPARGVAGPPGRFDGYRSTATGVVPTLLRNHVCALEGVIIDGHSDPDNSGSCIYCSTEMPTAAWVYGDPAPDGSYLMVKVSPGAPSKVIGRYQVPAETSATQVCGPTTES